jgi:hypothetical protein
MQDQFIIRKYYFVKVSFVLLILESALCRLLHESPFVFDKTYASANLFFAPGVWSGQILFFFFLKISLITCKSSLYGEMVAIPW